MDEYTVTSAVAPVPLLDLKRQYYPLREELAEVLVAVNESGQYVLGPEVRRLEAAVARANETKFGVGCASGSDALLLALMAVGVRPGDEVIVPSFTFFATASCVPRLGAVPVFAEAKNCMDIALVVGLVFMENLQNRSGCDISALTSVALPSAEAPSKVPSDALCRVINDRNMVSVVGGISINPFAAIENNTVEDSSIAELAKAIRISGNDWVAD